MNKVRFPAKAAFWKHPQNHEDYVLLKAADRKNELLITQLFSTKKKWEARNEREFYVSVTLELPYQRRTFKQNAAVWKLVTVIFESMEGRLPGEDEKYDLYLDLLEVYADRTPNKINGSTRPIHISESNSFEGSHFIDNLLTHLASECTLPYGVQTTVQEVLEEWESWRGSLETDYTDYSNREQTKMITEEEWREKRIYSEASGRGGVIERAHIISRGSDAADIEMSWNWIALTPEEHKEQHRRGWDDFLQIYPHLRGRVERARRLAGKLELKGLPQARTSLESLVNEAMSEVGA